MTAFRTSVLLFLSVFFLSCASNSQFKTIQEEEESYSLGQERFRR